MFRWASDRLGVWAFLVSIAFIPTIMSSAIVGRWAVIAMGAPLVAPIRWDIPDWLKVCIAVGFSWAATSVLIAPDRLDSLLQLFFVICLLGVMAVASQQSSIETAMEAMGWGVGVSALFCVLALDGDPVVAQGTPGYAGLFYNTEVLCEFAAPLAAWALVQRRWPLAAVTVLPILMNNSRISVAALVLALAIAFWPRAWKWRAAMALGWFAASLLLVWYMSLGDRFVSALNRILIWIMTAMEITPAGHGMGWFRSAHAAQEFAHSDVLQALAELGLGALFFVPIVARALRNTEARAEHAAFVIICVELVVSFPLHVPASGFLAALLAGYLVRNRAVVRHVRPDGGIDDGADDWSAAVWSRGYGDGGRRHVGLSVRHQAAAFSGVDLSRSRAQGAN